jgi:hypothetical protein
LRPIISERGAKKRADAKAEDEEGDGEEGDLVRDLEVSAVP